MYLKGYSDGSFAMESHRNLDLNHYESIYMIGYNVSGD